jgi:putative flavoprotein involved in K+ transport
MPLWVGAGHAGLSIGRALEVRGIEHVIVERDRIASAWRGRWESFCLVTPNWAVALTGAGYDGDDPDGYLGRDDLVAFIERYASATPPRYVRAWT